MQNMLLHITLELPAQAQQFISLEGWNKEGFVGNKPTSTEEFELTRKIYSIC
jgi:hypothetical protein